MFSHPPSLRRSRWQRTVQQINALETRVRGCDDRQLLEQGRSLRYRAQTGESWRRLLPESFALVREAARRALGQRLYDVQVFGGVALAHGCVAEMQTGEGKTLTATLPLYLHALPGRGCHLATVNDYLARRDWDWMRPVYERLGVTSGVVLAQHDAVERSAAYRCDITYGTAREFGFDFLRDRLTVHDLGGGSLEGTPAVRTMVPNDRRYQCALVDECDSVLIDDARTPLVIGVPGAISAVDQDCYRWACAAADHFQEDVHYRSDGQSPAVRLTWSGRKLLRLIPQPGRLRHVSIARLAHFVERAIHVAGNLRADRSYVVQGREVRIVDENTGRIADGRKWRGGIHQAVEAQADVPFSPESTSAARIPVQDFFLQYARLSGMTGTASDSTREFARVYGLPVVVVPTHRPVRRTEMPARVCGDQHEKWQAVVRRVQQLHATSRPILIGTRCIHASLLLSDLLSGHNLAHEVLNAHQTEREAAIVAQAGQPGRITVATNMAGRGTDIRLGPGVAELGGLHVICCELHESARIDRQLVGRCGRQGDPGSFDFFMAADDDVVCQARRWNLTRKDCFATEHEFRLAQRALQRRQELDRRILLRQERERCRVLREMGLDPYVDAVEHDGS
jgi:preprotein translocase subunit SecA